MNLTGTSLEEARTASERLLDVTVPQMLRERARECPDQVALRYKNGGVFRELTWSEYLDRVRQCATGLIDLGLDAGDRFAIMGDACLSYLIADVAACYMGAVPAGIYPTSSPDEVAYILELSGAQLFMAEDQEHLDRLLAAEEIAGRQLVNHIVMADTRTLFLYRDKRIVSFDELVRRCGDKAHLLAEVEDRSNAVTSDTIGEIIFTSGTTGRPKAACHTHRGIIYGFGYAFIDALPELRATPHRVISHLPLAHGMERGMTLSVPLIADVVPHIGEPNQSLTALMSEVRPTFVLGVPRMWEKMVAHVRVAIETSNWPARYLFSIAERIARRRTQAVWASGRRRAGPLLELAYWTAWLTMLLPAIHKLGLTVCKGGVSGGAPIPPAVLECIQSWGIPLRDFFGTTETSVVGTPTEPWPPADAAIRPIERVTFRIAEDGELFIAGPGIIAGYFGDDTSTNAMIADDGYLGTGDVAVPEGTGFRIVDRKKDIIITSGGKNIAPATIENALKASPYISEVIVFGDGRKYISCLIEIDFDSVAHWARQNEISYTGFVSLARNHKVIELIASELERYNQRLARVEQVKKFRIIAKELEPEDGDTTPTRKVKRDHAYKLFRDQVEEMYADETKIPAA